MCELCDSDDQLERDLNSMLSDASHGLQHAHQLYQQGKTGPEHIDWLLETRDTLAHTLAVYEDGDGYNSLSADYRNYATGAMRCLEEDATSLHQAILAEKQQAAA